VARGGIRADDEPSRSLADVFGVGLLMVGQSGIGKSECVLDLVERGHRLSRTISSSPPPRHRRADRTRT
jgi:hypothetical protein